MRTIKNLFLRTKEFLNNFLCFFRLSLSGANWCWQKRWRSRSFDLLLFFLVSCFFIWTRTSFTMFFCYLFSLCWVKLMFSASGYSSLTFLNDLISFVLLILQLLIRKWIILSLLHLFHRVLHFLSISFFKLNRWNTKPDFIFGILTLRNLLFLLR